MTKALSVLVLFVHNKWDDCVSTLRCRLDRAAAHGPETLRSTFSVNGRGFHGAICAIRSGVGNFKIIRLGAAQNLAFEAASVLSTPHARGQFVARQTSPLTLVTGSIKSRLNAHGWPTA